MPELFMSKMKWKESDLSESVAWLLHVVYNFINLHGNSISSSYVSEYVKFLSHNLNTARSGA